MTGNNKKATTRDKSQWCVLTHTKFLHRSELFNSKFKHVQNMSIKQSTYKDNCTKILSMKSTSHTILP